jgi:hypothetical protein
VQGASGQNGEGAMLWFQTDGTTAGLFLNQFRNGQWGSAAIPVDVAGSGGGSQGQLAIVRGPAELVTWIAGSAVWANLRTASGWTGAVSIRTATGNVVSDVRLVSDVRGEAAIAIWLEQGSTRTSVWTSRFSGGTWSAAVNIETSPSGNAGSPRIALEPSGIAVAVWTQVATRVDVWANRFAPGMGWGTAARIESDDAGDATAPSVAVDSRGNARAVWQQSDGTRVNVLSNYFE